MGNELDIDQETHRMKHSRGGYRWQSAFGSTIINYGTFIWKLKMIEKSRNGNSMCLGVIDVNKINKSSIHSTDFIGGRVDLCDGYGYYSYHGHKYHNRINKSYGEGFDVGDIISVILDMDNLTLRFEKNGKDQGIAYENLEKVGYIFGISTHNIGDEWEWIYPL